MAGATLLTLLDDITTLLDDVSAMTKVATQKTAGVLGDDLALNANQVAGVDPSREIPVVLAVAKGSAVNKAILVPSALALSAVAPMLVTPLLMLGGSYLCFEGAEKVAHKLLHPEAEDQEHEQHAERVLDPNVDLVALERDKIKGAIRTDFVLSAEIVVIALGTVTDEPFVTRALVLVALSALMTIGVYGLVAGIVKLDDAGLHLGSAQGEDASARTKRALGRLLLGAAPKLMAALSVLGTLAMFLVGGGIVAHAVPFLHHLAETVEHALKAVPAVGGALAALGPAVFNGLVGLCVGALLVLVFEGVRKARGR